MSRASTIADRMLEPLADCLTREVAERIVQTGNSPDVQSRVDELAAKANDGTLTEEERAEYSEYVEWADIIGIFKARARLVLQHRPA